MKEGREGGRRAKEKMKMINADMENIEEELRWWGAEI